MTNKTLAALKFVAEINGSFQEQTYGVFVEINHRDYGCNNFGELEILIGNHQDALRDNVSLIKQHSEDPSATHELVDFSWRLLNTIRNELSINASLKDILYIHQVSAVKGGIARHKPKDLLLFIKEQRQALLDLANKLAQSETHSIVKLSNLGLDDLRRKEAEIDISLLTIPNLN